LSTYTDKQLLGRIVVDPEIAEKKETSRQRPMRGGEGRGELCIGRQESFRSSPEYSYQPQVKPENSLHHSRRSASFIVRMCTLSLLVHVSAMAAERQSCRIVKTDANGVEHG
jgi:hypothetical protein